MDEIQQLLDLINAQRKQPLNLSTSLTVVSQKHADKEIMDHAGFMERAAEAGYVNVPVAENLALSDNAQNTYQMWMRSSAHKQNMLNETYNVCGLAHGQRLWVLLLAHETPKEAKA